MHQNKSIDYPFSAIHACVLRSNLYAHDCSRDWITGRLRQLQHVLRHEAEILSDDIDLLVVVDLMRIVRLPAPVEDEHHLCRAVDATFSQQWGSAGHGDRAIGLAAEGGAEAQFEDPLHLQPLFASCSSSSNSSMQRDLRRLLGDLVTGGRDNPFPCSISTHLLGGRAASVSNFSTHTCLTTIRTHAHT